MKKIGLLALGLALSMGIVAEAGSIPTNRVPLHTYAIKYLDCYLQPGGIKKGYIDAGDYVIVEQIRSDGWAYGSYPVGKTRTKRWFKADDLVNNIGFANQDRYSPKSNTYVYRNPNHNQQMGSFNNNEDIVVVSDSGDSRQVIYKLSNGNGYKMGWVPYWDCWDARRAGKQEVNNNTINKNPIVTPVKREEKKEEAKSYGQWDATIKYRANTYNNANLSGARVGWVTAGSDIVVLGENDKSYFIRYWTDSGAQRERYVQKDAVGAKAQQSTTVQDNLDNKLNQLKVNYPSGSKWNGSFDGAIQCHGFALLLGNKLCGYSARKWSRAYDVSSIKQGDIIRYQKNTNRSRWSKWGHTILITKVNGDSVSYVDCNSYATNTVYWENNVTKSYLKGLFLSGDYILVYPK